MPLIDGTDYITVRGSDVDRDGMTLEIFAAAGTRSEALAEVFYSDATGAFVTEVFAADLSPRVVQWLESEARSQLPARKPERAGELGGPSA